MWHRRNTWPVASGGEGAECSGFAAGVMPAPAHHLADWQGLCAWEAAGSSAMCRHLTARLPCLGLIVRTTPRTSIKQRGLLPWRQASFLLGNLKSPNPSLRNESPATIRRHSHKVDPPKWTVEQLTTDLKGAPRGRRLGQRGRRPALLNPLLPTRALRRLAAQGSCVEAAALQLEHWPGKDPCPPRLGPRTPRKGRGPAEWTRRINEELTAGVAGGGCDGAHRPQEVLLTSGNAPASGAGPPSPVPEAAPRHGSPWGAGSRAPGRPQPDELLGTWAPGERKVSEVGGAAGLVCPRAEEGERVGPGAPAPGPPC